MATCKKCLHSRVCFDSDGTTRYYGPDIAANNVEDLCPCFADRSKYVVREKGEWQRVVPTKSAAKWSNKVACPVCHSAGHIRHNFCPNCGADMRERRTKDGI